MSKIAKACRLQKRNQFNILRDRTQTSGARRRQQHGSPLIEAGEYEGMSLPELFIKQPTKFLKEYVDHDGDSDPFIVAADKSAVAFSAWDYAAERSAVIAKPKEQGPHQPLVTRADPSPPTNL